MLEKYWIKCPICNGKTRVQVFYNTVLRNFPLFCPKCKLTHIIDVEKLEIIIKNSEKQKEGYTFLPKQLLGLIQLRQMVDWFDLRFD